MRRHPQGTTVPVGATRCDSMWPMRLSDAGKGGDEGYNDGLLHSDERGRGATKFFHDGGANEARAGRRRQQRNSQVKQARAWFPKSMMSTGEKVEMGGGINYADIVSMGGGSGKRVSGCLGENVVWYWRASGGEQNSHPRWGKLDVGYKLTAR